MADLPGFYKFVVNMRVEFAQAMVALSTDPKLMFFTGDLGFMALEKVRDSLGQRFINAGVAEQNMVTMAAACAQAGFSPWVYSIAPFVTLRPYEQIRVDVCLHDLPVKLVGNGGGYGYGIMGGTHHNPEDIGAMRLLPNMEVYVPYTSADVQQAVLAMHQSNHPAYLRLNLAAQTPTEVAPFAPWRQLQRGQKAVVIGCGPVTAQIFQLPEDVQQDVSVWLLSQIPCLHVPEQLLEEINACGKILFIEEHYAAGGIAEWLSLQLLSRINRPVQVAHAHAAGYPSGKYGSQAFHQEESGLRGQKLEANLRSLLEKQP